MGNLKISSAGKIRTEINAVFAADNLYMRINRWWEKATVDGVGQGLGHHYLQYSKALRVLKIDLEIVREYEKELLALPDLFPGVRRQISSDLDIKKSLLNEHIEKLETGGWQAVFEKQKMMSKTRWNIRNRYSKTCQSSISAFFDASKANIKEGNFNNIEDIYHQQVVECSKV